MEQSQSAGDENASNLALSDNEIDLFGHLPSHEREILKRQLDVAEQKISFIDLYRYATKIEPHAKITSQAYAAKE